MADPAHELTDKKLEEMEKRLTAIYSRAEKEIQKTADDYFAQFKRLDAQKRKLVESGELSEKEYKTWRRNKMLYSKRFAEMKEQAAQQLLHVNETAIAYINDQLPEVYALNYNALRAQVEGVGGYSFTLTDPSTIKHLALADESLLPFKELDPAKDIPWNMKKINSEVLQGIITGESIPKIAGRIGGVQTMNLNAAVRTARTIVTEAENKGRLDSYKRAQADGIELKREWISTDDKRTRPWHAELDGVLVDVDEPWENSVGKIMFPGDPEADGANVYNCRCTQAAKVIGFNKRKTKETSIPYEEPEEEFDPFKALMDPQYAQKFNEKRAEKEALNKLGQNGIAETVYPKKLQFTRKEQKRIEDFEKYLADDLEEFKYSKLELWAAQGSLDDLEIIEKARKDAIFRKQKAEQMIKTRKEEGYKGKSRQEAYKDYMDLRKELAAAYDDEEKLNVLEDHTVGESGIRFWQIQRKDAERELEQLDFAEKLIRRRNYAKKAKK